MSIRGLVAGMLIIVGSSAIAAPAEAQDPGDGCPWCTSPSSCEKIDQNAADECTVPAGGWCRNGSGLCVIGETDEELAAMLAAGAPKRTALSGDREVTVIGIGDGQFVAWSCSGKLALLFEDDGGTLRPLPIMHLDALFLSLPRKVSSDASRSARSST
jgi:hypothetical protein